jgi:protease IV
MIAFMFRLLWLVLTLPLLPLRLWRRARAAPKGAFLEFELKGPLHEGPPPKRRWFGSPRGFSLHAFRSAVKLAAADPKVAGLVLHLHELRGGGATALSLRQILESMKRAGKRVIVYLPDGGGTREVYAALAGDVVYAGHETMIAPLGFGVQSVYFGGALEQIGLKPEVFARGRYKTAAEQWASDSMSDAQREQVGRVLDVLWDDLLGAITEGRKISRERAEALVADAPLGARRAVNEGLIDGVCHKDELAKKIDERVEPKLVDGFRYARRRGFRLGLVRRRKLAVVEVHGAIVSSAMGPMAAAIESEIVEALDAVREDRRTAGAILHVDSRGGGALASARILHAVRRLAKEKPVVACFGDVAASGGYMVAAGAHEIISQPNALTGSIGVISARIALNSVLERVGARVETLKRGEHANIFGVLHALDDSERATLRREIDEMYAAFVGAVSEGRGLSPERVDELAQGRVWCGKDAAEHKLVDALGGFDLALERVTALVGKRAGELEPVTYRTKAQRFRVPSPLGMLLSRDEASASAAGGALFGFFGRVFSGLQVFTSLGRERALFWCPWGEIDLFDR